MTWLDANRRYLLAAGACLMFALWLGFEIGGPRVTLVFDDVAMTVLPLFAFVCCARTAARSEGRGRWAWWLLGLSCASWGVGQFVWSVYEILLGREVPFPSLADIGYLGSYPLALAGVLLLPSRRARTVSRLRAMCDGLIVSGSILFASWATVLGPTFRDSSGPALMHILGLAYPVADVVLISVALTVARRSVGGSRLSTALIASGLTAIAVSDTAFAYFTSTGSYSTGNLIDIGWFIGFMLIALAASAERVGPVGEPDTGHQSGRSLLVYGPTLVVAVGQSQEHLEPFLAILGAAVFVLVVIRQMATNAENVSLTSDLRLLATHDPLTGLPNRTLLVERLQHAARRGGGDTVGVLFFDIDHFKRINDTYGHAAGDAVLVEAAARLRRACRPSDLVARFAGDEFVIVCEELRDRDDAVRLADRVLESLEEPLDVQGRQLRVTASVGIAFGANELLDPDMMLHDADLALFEAKARGRGRHLVYSDVLRGRGQHQLEMAQSLRAAIDNGELSIAFQPIVDVDNGRAVGVEALARWVRPDGTEVPPLEFIAVAEENGFIEDLGLWVLETSCREVGSWDAAADGSFYVAVNISPLQLNERLVRDVQHALRASRLRADQLCLEITEGAVMIEPATSMLVLHALRRVGVGLAVDDFGTGHSSLAYLKELPVNSIKIDRTFVAGLGDDTRDDAIIAAVIGIGRAAGMNVVAEGVENETQANRLRALGCDFAQGYHFARPAQAAVIAPLVARKVSSRTHGADRSIPLHVVEAS